MIKIHFLDKEPILWHKGQYDTYGSSDALDVYLIMVEGIELREIKEQFKGIPMVELPEG